MNGTRIIKFHNKECLALIGESKMLWDASQDVLSYKISQSLYQRAIFWYLKHHINI